MFHEISTEFSQTRSPATMERLVPVLKGAARSFVDEIQTHSFDFYNINEIKIPTQVYLSFP